MSAPAQCLNAMKTTIVAELFDLDATQHAGDERTAALLEAESSDFVAAANREHVELAAVAKAQADTLKQARAGIESEPSRKEQELYGKAKLHRASVKAQVRSEVQHVINAAGIRVRVAAKQQAPAAPIAAALTVKELKARLTTAGLSKMGLKSELVARLTAHEAAAAAAAAPPAAAPPAAAPPAAAKPRVAAGARLSFQRRRCGEVFMGAVHHLVNALALAMTLEDKEGVPYEDVVKKYEAEIQAFGRIVTEKMTTKYLGVTMRKQGPELWNWPCVAPATAMRRASTQFKQTVLHNQDCHAWCRLHQMVDHVGGMMTRFRRLSGGLCYGVLQTKVMVSITPTPTHPPTHSPTRTCTGHVYSRHCASPAVCARVCRRS